MGLGLTTRNGYSPKVLLTWKSPGGKIGAFKPKESKHMKKYNSLTPILGLACACLIFVGCATNQPGAATAPPPNSARLLVNRVANFGSDLSLVLSVDGKDVGSFTEGRNYSGYLSAGQHVITARVNPNLTGAGPAQKTLNVKAGQTYSFTAGLSGEKMTLVRNQGQTVPTY
jgi:hypothetical protein